MSDITVPCRQPYDAFPQYDDDATIILIIGSGSEMERISAPIPLLCHGSEYFDERYVHPIHHSSHLQHLKPSPSPSLRPSLPPRFIHHI